MSVEKIRQYREQLGITQKQLANRLGIDRSMIAKWEIGVNKPRADRLVKLAEIFQCSVDELFK